MQIGSSKLTGYILGALFSLFCWVLGWVAGNNDKFVRSCAPAVQEAIDRCAEGCGNVQSYK